MTIQWMRVGFVHGVMNTDNMSILGLTIDYGPYGWLEGYDENWTPNTTDASGKRYSFGRQAEMAHWNLVQLAQAISFVFEDIEPLKTSLDKFVTEYQSDLHTMMLSKLGLTSKLDDDESLITDLQNILHLTETDMPIFYRQLADLNIEAYASKNLDGVPKHLKQAYYQTEELEDDIEHTICQWIKQYSKRALLEIKAEPSSAEFQDQLKRRKITMNQVNPKYVMRNYLAQQAIDLAEEGDYTQLNELLEVMRHPYEDQPTKEEFSQKRPEWARNKPGCSMLSCSS